MGLIRWRTDRHKPVSRIVFGSLLVLLFIMFVFLFVRGIITGSIEIAGAVIIGIMLLFFLPFMLFGGINEIREAIDDIKEKKDESTH